MWCNVKAVQPKNVEMLRNEHPRTFPDNTNCHPKSMFAHIYRPALIAGATFAVWASGAGLVDCYSAIPRLDPSGRKRKQGGGHTLTPIQWVSP